MAVEKKVMDVGKPGLAKPETGSKPMVIGHKTLLTDPTIKKDTEEPQAENQEEIKKTEKPKVDIKPISESEKAEISAEKPEVSESQSTEETKSDENKTEESAETPATEQEPNQEQVKQDKQKEEAEQVVERSDRLEEIIKSKEYFVPIKESNKAAVRTFAVTSLIVILVGIVMVTLLIDAEILDLGVELPFNLL